MWIVAIIAILGLCITSYYLIYYKYQNLLLKNQLIKKDEIINNQSEIIYALPKNKPKDNSKDLLKEIKELNIILDDKEAHIIALDNDITHLRYLLKTNNKTSSNKSLKQQQHTKNKEESFYTKVVGIYKPYSFVEKEFLKDLEMLIKIKHLKS
jgi:phosphotransferase system IIB component